MSRSGPSMNPSRDTDIIRTILRTAAPPPPDPVLRLQDDLAEHAAVFEPGQRLTRPLQRIGAADRRVDRAGLEEGHQLIPLAAGEAPPRPRGGAPAHPPGGGVF